MKEENKQKEHRFHFETLQLHAGQETPDSATGSRCVPIYQTASYVFDSCAQAAARFDLSEAGPIYTRLGNPTTDAFEQRMAALEGGTAALATASGSAAVTYAIQNIARAGDHIIAADTLYGGTYNLFAHTLADFGVKTSFISCDSENGSTSDQILANFESTIRPNTKAIYAESLGNPNSSLLDLESLAEIAHRHGLPLIVDNTFATPYLLRPFEWGADIVVHSATKFIGGHGTSIGGVIVDGGRFDWSQSHRFPSLSQPEPGYHGIRFTEAAGKNAFITRIRTCLMRDTGACPSPFHSFLFLQGLETLSLRVERHSENARLTAEFLKQSPQIERVNHPCLEEHPHHLLYQKYFPKGGGSIFTVDVKGGAEKAMAFIDRLQLFSLLANVADSKSLVIHPASTTHSQMSAEEQLAVGIRPGTVRLSIGTEHIDDILYDLSQALA